MALPLSEERRPIIWRAACLTCSGLKTWRYRGKAPLGAPADPDPVALAATWVGLEGVVSVLRSGSAFG